MFCLVMEGLNVQPIHVFNNWARQNVSGDLMHVHALLRSALLPNLQLMSINVSPPSQPA